MRLCVHVCVSAGTCAPHHASGGQRAVLGVGPVLFEAVFLGCYICQNSWLVLQASKAVVLDLWVTTPGCPVTFSQGSPKTIKKTQINITIPNNGKITITKQQRK